MGRTTYFIYIDRLHFSSQLMVSTMLTSNFYAVFITPYIVAKVTDFSIPCAMAYVVAHAV